MKSKEKIKRFISLHFFISGEDSVNVKRSKILNIILLILGFICGLTLLIPSVFTVLGLSYGFEGGEATIYTGCFIMISSTIILFLIKRYYSRVLASILFIVIVNIIIFFVEDPAMLSSGVGIFWFLFPVLLAGLLLKSIWILFLIFINFIIIIIQYSFAGVVPPFIELLGFFLFSAIIMLSSRTMEKSLEKSETAYKRLDFYRDIFSHDISNILQSILSSVELISSKKEEISDGEMLETLLNMIHSEIDKGRRLIENIRLLTKLEKKKEAIQRIDLCESLKESIEIIKKRFLIKKINIETNLFREQIYVQANQFLLYIFLNLLRNAIIFNKNQNVEILINTMGEEIDKVKHIKVEIVDNGRGIKDKRKMEIFQRSIENVEDLSRIGLGLTLVNNIIESYDGKIWIENRIKNDYSKGSKFIIVLPTTNIN